MVNPSPKSDNKIFFNGGDLVKHKLPGSPLMLVSGPQKFKDNESGDTQLIGIKCEWFTQDGKLERYPFNSKDLRHATKAEIEQAQVISIAQPILN